MTKQATKTVEKSGPESLVERRAAFADAIGHRSLEPRSWLHEFTRATFEWTVGRFNISVCDLLFDSIAALKSGDVSSATSFIQSAKHILNIWRREQLPLGGNGGQAPTQHIRSFSGKISLQKLVRQVDVCERKMLALSKVYDASKAEEVLNELKEAVLIVAPGNARQQEKKKYLG